MSEGYIHKGVEAISESLQSKPNLEVETHYIETATPNAVPGLKTELVNLGDHQIRKISPYEPSDRGTSVSFEYNITGANVSNPPAFKQLFDRLTSMFGSGEPLKAQSLVSFSETEKSPSNMETGEVSKTSLAMSEFKEAQKVTVGFGLLSALTQSVLSSVKRLTQGQ